MTTASLKNVRLPLARRERLIACLSADGMVHRDIALVCSVGIETSKSAVKRVRAKYSNAGRFAGTRLALRAQLVADGLMVEVSP